EFDAAECYTSLDAAGCVAALQNVARSSERQKQLVANARRMYHSRFEPSRIHAVLLRECEKLVRLQHRLSPFENDSPSRLSALSKMAVAPGLAKRNAPARRFDSQID